MKNKSLTPQIRFKGYEDEWVSRPFSRYSLLKYDETIPSVEYEDINSKKGTLNKDIFSKPIHKSGQYFQIGDILFGKLRPYLGNNLLANFDGIAKMVLLTQGSFIHFYIQRTTHISRTFHRDQKCLVPTGAWSLHGILIYQVRRRNKPS